MRYDDHDEDIPRTPGPSGPANAGDARNAPHDGADGSPRTEAQQGHAEDATPDSPDVTDDTGSADTAAPTRRPGMVRLSGCTFLGVDTDGEPAVLDDPVFLMPEVAATIPPDVLAPHLPKRKG